MIMHASSFLPYTGCGTTAETERAWGHSQRGRELKSRARQTKKWV